MKKIIFLISFISFSISAFAGNENQSYGARSGAMGNASVTLADEWSTVNNQAGLGFVRNISAGTFYEDRFLIKQLSSQAFALALPVKGGTFGLSYTSFGYSAYSENKYGLAFGKSFGQNISAGIQMDYLTTHIAENYGSKGVLAAEAGLQFRITKKLILGVHAYNITRARLADYDNEHVPTVMRLGLQYKFSDKVFIAVETEKDMDRKAMLKAGMEYMVAKILYVRAGICSNPSLSCFGFGLKLKGFRLDVTSTYHSVLGFSPQLGLHYDFK